MPAPNSFQVDPNPRKSRRGTPRFTLYLRWMLLGGAVLGSLAAAGIASAIAQASDAGHGSQYRRHANHQTRHRRRAMRRAASAAPPLVFGIYPGGAAGSVGPGGATRPEDPAKRLAALQQLRAPGRPFVVHLYAGYTGPGGWSAADQVGDEISQYTAAGFQVELVLCYRPSDGGSAAEVSGFTSFVRDAVRAFGPNSSFVSLQVTNEANVGGAPNASDGYYAGAKDALIQGIIAAADESRSDGFSQVKVGFNWAYDTSSSESDFWSYLGRHGGRAFLGALDWVGLDAYPGTWGPSLQGQALSDGVSSAITNALHILRSNYLPLAGIPGGVPLHVCENGYPTGPHRTDAMQIKVLRAAVDTLDRVRGRFNVTDYRWFDLRDADSSSSSFESQYGLLRDDYSPKPAFDVYRHLITTLSG